MLLLLSANSYATQYDYSDAPAPYGTAWHDTDTWQKLGTKWNKENNALTPDLDTSDDGVWWSLDNGATYGHDEVYAGQTILLKADMWSAGFGNHAYDQIKVWVDFNQDNIFQNYINSPELVIAQQFFKPANMIVDDTKQGWVSGPSMVNSYFAYITIPKDIFGDLWLRARVSCWHTPFADSTPYGEMWQGEVEDWKISVNPVPEPASLLLLGIGLISLAAIGRKRTK